MRSPASLLALPALLLLAGCPSDGTPDGPVDPTVTWIEEDDEDNDDFDDPEEVDVVWTTRLLIEGTARECDYDNDAGANEWPWTGDLDNYEIHVPERGFLEATLSWETETDYDLIELTFEGNTVGMGEASLRNRREPGEENILWDEEFRTDEEVVLQVACAQGEDEGDYVLEILWEE